MNVAEFLQRADEWLYHVINYQLAAPWLDGVMRTLRYAPAWIPLYALLLYLFWKKMPRQFWPILIISLLAFALADSVSARLLKPAFGRIRPCYNQSIEYATRHVIGCGGKYSFPSAHAANHFALALFWFCCVRRFTGRNWWWLWCWALAIGWAQVYVGVHYPGDILGGALLGLLVGSGCYGLLLLWSGWRPRRMGRRRMRTPYTLLGN